MGHYISAPHISMPPPFIVTVNAAIKSGDLARMRALFDQAFWRNEKFVPQWEHLKIALIREDQPMIRLLATWGARAPKDRADLEGIAPEKLATYAKILRRYGLDATVVEKAAAEPLPIVAPVPETSKTLEIGQAASSQGIYLGQYKPKDRKGNSLGKVFNVFAAPEDLPETMKYVDAVKYIADLKGWNGFDGTKYKNDKEIYKALKGGSYNGGWIIPPQEILKDHLYKFQNKGALKGTFKTVVSSGSGFSVWYWSSTKYRDISPYVFTVGFSDGARDWFRKDILRLSCRPVRLEEFRPEIGTQMLDGTIYAGVSPDTKKLMYVLPQNESLMVWEEAMMAAREKGACGYKDWRVPTDSELTVLAQNKERGALKGTFNETIFWSCLKDKMFNNAADACDFRSGTVHLRCTDKKSSVRLVRS